jgi:hypothetical protein
MLGFTAIVARVEGCTTSDLRHGASICAVHHVNMETRTIPIAYGLPSDGPPEGYFQAGQHSFPNADQRIMGGCMVHDQKTALVWFCPECARAKADWLREHGADPQRPFN